MLETLLLFFLLSLAVAALALCDWQNLKAGEQLLSHLQQFLWEGKVSEVEKQYDFYGPLFYLLLQARANEGVAIVKVLKKLKLALYGELSLKRKSHALFGKTLFQSYLLCLCVWGFLLFLKYELSSVNLSPITFFYWHLFGMLGLTVLFITALKTLDKTAFSLWHRCLHLQIHIERGGPIESKGA